MAHFMDGLRRLTAGIYTVIVLRGQASQNLPRLFPIGRLALAGFLGRLVGFFLLSAYRHTFPLALVFVPIDMAASAVTATIRLGARRDSSTQGL